MFHYKIQTSIKFVFSNRSTKTRAAFNSDSGKLQKLSTKRITKIDAQTGKQFEIQGL